MDSAVDKLASVSRVMFDQRMIDMNKEINSLKSELAWEHFGPREMNHLLCERNTTGLEIICTCEACLISKRFCECDLDILNETFKLKENEDCRECIVKKCLKFHCKRLGLICIEQEADEEDSDDDEEDDALFSTKKECHIFITNHDCGNTAWKFGYGTMLSPDKFHENPDLVKVQVLLSLIDETVEFFKTDEVDFFTVADERE
jgi:hypothetical protein